MRFSWGGGYNLLCCYGPLWMASVVAPDAQKKLFLCTTSEGTNRNQLTPASLLLAAYIPQHKLCLGHGCKILGSQQVGQSFLKYLKCIKCPSLPRCPNSLYKKRCKISEAKKEEQIYKLDVVGPADVSIAPHAPKLVNIKKGLKYLKWRKKRQICKRQNFSDWNNFIFFNQIAYRNF